MRLYKKRPHSDIQYILKEDIQSNYIQASWFNVADEEGNSIGTMTGYTLNLPLIMNDILTKKKHSAVELDCISQLCSDLWCALNDNKELFKDKPGELYFLNRLESKNPTTFKESHMLDLLKEKYGIIIYSFGMTELFDDFENEWDEAAHLEHEQMLLDSGWDMLDEDFYIFENEELTKKIEFTHDGGFPCSDDFNPLLEQWVKDKGLNWIQSMWDGILKERRTIAIIDKIKGFKDNNHEFLDGISFMKNTRFIDFKQFDPRGGYLRKAPKHAIYLRAESVYVKYKKDIYVIHLHQDIFNGETEPMNMISIGKFNKETGYYDIGKENIFDEFTASWLETVFEELFNRCYEQFVMEQNPTINKMFIKL